MKKILSVLLIITCLLSVVSCDRGTGGQDALALFEGYFAISAPTKSVTTVKQTLESTTLESTYSVKTGTVNGKAASIYESSVQSLNDIESRDLNYILTTNSNLWYYEGMGTSTNKGAKWNAEGVDFAPAAGDMALNLSNKDNFKSVTYTEETETLVLEVEAAKSTVVLEKFNLGSAHKYDTVITVVAAGGRIANVKIEYTIPEHMIGKDMESMITIKNVNVVIEATYSYDIQNISFE